jgi:serine protease Do
MSRTPKTTALLLALLMAGLPAGTHAQLSHQATGAPLPVAGTAAAPPASVLPIAASTLPDFARITERYGPAVVNISVTGTRKGAAADPDDAADPFELFRRFQQGPGRITPREVPVRGMGSGFIVSPDGIILTNAHVVRGAGEVNVKLTDRREYRAKVLGSDPKTDVAVLKIEARNLPVVTLGNAKDLRAGEWVLAIGSPFGFENTVTAGVVSAKARSLPDDSAVSFIQTDVAVNPGNSGGPLFNARGEVVGMNSQIYSRSGGYQGVSFAIPVDVAIRVKNQIVATGKVQHARLGVTVQEVNQALADSFRLDRPEGALIASVEKGSPAEKAGLQPGDVVRNANGQAIVASSDLSALVGLSTPGDRVRMEVWRQGRRMDVTAQLAAAADKFEKAEGPGGETRTAGGKLGLSLRPLDETEKRLASVASGLLVEDVSGPAARAGVQPGDVVLAVNGTPAKSVEQVRATAAASEKSVALLIQRGGEKIFVPVRIG